MLSQMMAVQIMNTKMVEVMNNKPRTCFGTMKAIDAMQAMLSALDYFYLT